MPPVDAPSDESPLAVFQRAKNELGGLDGIAEALNWDRTRLSPLVEVDIEMESERPLKHELETALDSLKQDLLLAMARLKQRVTAVDFLTGLMVDEAPAPEPKPEPQRPTPIRAIPPRRAPTPPPSSPPAAAQAQQSPRNGRNHAAVTPRPPAVDALRTPEPLRVQFKTQDFELAYGTFLAQRFTIFEPWAASIMTVLARSWHYTKNHQQFCKAVNAISSKGKQKLYSTTLPQHLDPILERLSREPFFARWSKKGGALHEFFTPSPAELVNLVIEALKNQQSRVGKALESTAESILETILERNPTAKDEGTNDEEANDEGESSSSEPLGDAWLGILFKKVLVTMLKAQRQGDGVYHSEPEERGDLARLQKRFPGNLQMLPGGRFKAPNVRPLKGYVPHDKMIDAISLETALPHFRSVLGPTVTFPAVDALQRKAHLLIPPDLLQQAIQTGSTVPDVYRKFPPGSRWYINPSQPNQLTDGLVTIVAPDTIPNFSDLVASTPALQHGSVMITWNDGGARGAQRSIIEPSKLVTREQHATLLAEKENRKEEVQDLKEERRANLAAAREAARLKFAH